ncbi:hypothetical protein FA13DRAFT_620510 [Coprinellus micaceus]|uniref:MYND-type domain-containing protein n=1 Tax=Coprinellus micaceus TaxID=71717 RepID=A0A4Y7T655_COPMI|nr:hypothetical protein FA13DRAFT_620510 [Coprinellus micaceus]
MAQQETSTISKSMPTSTPSAYEPPLCDYCYDHPGRFTCAGCRKKRYCSKSCQERSWETHIFDCDAKKKIKSFHHLARAVSRDLLPTDQQTLDDWGFDRANSCEGHAGPIMLFGLYTGLLRYLDIPAKTLDQWRRNGVLLEEIKQAYGTIPEGSRGGYYPWLLKNKFTIDRSLPLPNSPEDTANRTLRDGCRFAGETLPASISSIRQHIASMPPKKGACIALCGMLLNRCHPSPIQTLWLDFGFCIGGQYSELCAGRLYQKLVASASFREILGAYETCGMVALFRKKGLTSDPDYKCISEQFEDVMSGSGRGTFKSSWNLKQFIQAKTDNPKSDVAIIPSVRVDYGFMNCTDAHDLATLINLYQEYFQSDKNNCIHLHNACIKGALFEYLGNFSEVPLKESHRRLLRNLYPLPDPGF